MADCSELIQKLFSFPRRGKSSQTLSRMRKIDEWQGYLHRRYASIHVAGTNGKGSVSCKIAQALRAANLKVGLYTSPHISSFRERIVVNGEMISPKWVETFLPKLLMFVEKEKIQPSFFELLTALAFQYFSDQKIDAAVFEAGLGGEFDATNVILPKLSVITSISYDHMEILGSTLNDIARAKAGIIKDSVPLVIGPNAAFDPILQKAAGHIIFAPRVEGDYDHENSAIARTALEYLQVPEEAILKGLQCRPRCRFEVIDPRPVILDVAHNLDGFCHLKKAIDRNFPNMLFHVVLGLGRGKDPAQMMEFLRPVARKISCVSNGHVRLAEAKELQARLRQKDFSNVDLIPSLQEALQLPGPVLICGSFFIMDDAMNPK